MPETSPPASLPPDDGAGRAETVLITGGAGFIGAHVAAELLEAGYRVRVFDNLSPQVHGTPPGHGGQGRPDYLDPRAELIVGDMTDAAAVAAALDGADSAIHLAAMVGVGQSMYRIADYTAANDLGTAHLLQALIEAPLRRLVVASSMSIYGEGRHVDADGRAHDRLTRDPAALEAGRWDPAGPGGAPLYPVPTPEDKIVDPTSIYALGKYVQERQCLIAGPAYGIETVALRLFNVYGPHQALSNPYTGVLAIFGSRFLNGKAPKIFEDGAQKRDFVHVTDVARAFRLALERPGISGRSFNVASGETVTVRQVADTLAEALGKPGDLAEVTGRYRTGDVRHCFADTALARADLGFEARVPFAEGVAGFVEWLATQTAEDRVDGATEELTRRGLVA